MLIRLCSHFPENSRHIDKLIAIKGLPEEWLFRTTKHGKELVKPWEPDVEANIPKYIRHLCEPVEIAMVFPPLTPKDEVIVDYRTIIGLRFNFMTQPGQELWEKVWRYVEGTIPRNEKVPKPVLVAPDHKSPFETYEARRSVRGSLELHPADIPEIDLTKYTQTVSAPVPQPLPEMEDAVREILPTESAGIFRCSEPNCGRVFDKSRAVMMHIRHMHKKEKAVV
jgi:hypothetical protein